MPGLLDTIVDAYQKGMSLLAPSQRDVEMRPKLAKELMQFLPISGDAISGYDAYQSAKEKKYGEAALNGIGLLPFIPSLGGITVWHGTPHKFAPTKNNPLGEFDLSKIGTGEGAQAYGHGVYVAENPSVAKEYLKIDPQTSLPPRRLFRGQELDPGTPEYHAARLLDETSLAKARKDVTQWIDEGTPDANLLAGWKRTLEVLNKAEKKSDFKRTANKPNLYKVDLPDEHLSRFLDWDKPLSQQPEIMSALENAGIPAISKNALGWNGAPTGTWENALGQRSGEWLYRELLDNNQAATSSKLKDLGILGTKYLDGGSRGAGKGSSNYVVFDPSILKILERQ